MKDFVSSQSYDILISMIFFFFVLRIQTDHNLMIYTLLLVA